MLARPCIKNIFFSTIQDTFNLLPNLNVAELSKSFVVESNDMMLVIYLASLIRSVIALHNLIDNKEGRAHVEQERVRYHKYHGDDDDELYNVTIVERIK